MFDGVWDRRRGFSSAAFRSDCLTLKVANLEIRAQRKGEREKEKEREKERNGGRRGELGVTLDVNPSLFSTLSHPSLQKKGCL